MHHLESNQAVLTTIPRDNTPTPITPFQYMGQLIWLACPILIAHMVEAFIPFINNMLAGRQGPLALAAAGLATNTFFTVMGFGWGIIVSVGILTSHQLGKTQNSLETGAILKSSLLTSLLISLPIMGLMKSMEPLWLLAGQSAEIAHLGQSFLDGLIWVVFADLAKFSVFQFAIAHHKPGVPLIANLLSIPLTWLVNIPLITHWGLYGLGIGTALVYWLVFALLWLYLRLSSRAFRQCLKKSLSWQDYKQHCGQQLKLGIPMGIIVSIELFFSMAMGILMGQIGTDPLTAHQIAMQWLWFTIMAAVGLSEAVTILVARASIWRDTFSMLRFIRAGVTLTTITMLAVACLYWFAPQAIIHLDLAPQYQTTGLIKLTSMVLMLCGFYQILDGIRIIFTGGLRGLADTQYPMWLSLIAFWLIGFPTAYGAAFFLGWHSIGLWSGMIFTQIIMIILQYYRLRKLLKAT
jgi:multidrug resistance protein, MATE family